MWWSHLVILVLAVDAPSPRVLTFEEALHQAAEHQPLLERYRQERASSVARAAQLRSLNYPQVGIGLQTLAATSNNSPISYLSMTDFARVGNLGGAAPGSAMPGLSTLVGVGAHYLVTDFGATRHSIEAADASAGVAAYQAGQALQDVLLRAAVAYFQCEAAHETLEIARESLKRADQHHALAAAGVRTGLKPKIDLSRSDAELAAARLDLIRAQNAVAVCHGALDAAMGWWPGEYELAPLPAVEEAPEPIPDEAASELAIRARPDLLALGLEEAGAEAQYRAASSGYFPRLLATASASLRGYNEAPKTFNWDVGLVLSVPVFNGFLTQGQEDEATARLAATRAQVRVARDAMTFQLRQARATVVASREAVRASSAQVVSTLANLEQAEARYREGLGNIVELADAQVQYATAQLGLVQSRTLLAISSVQFKHAYAGLITP
jgi:outer membrane protein